jgi:hypothetical protein
VTSHPTKSTLEMMELKYLRNNKTAGADSIAAELLKYPGFQLVDPLKEVIHLVWTSETLPESLAREGCIFNKQTQNLVTPMISTLSVEAK